ncbi:hypothetical protein [Variovorax guangxiensis]|nr:hypothetical protein [Variovorax guangxiensis]MDR6860793.1 hypothetical protein [Variovorax guangxiensis]
MGGELPLVRSMFHLFCVLTITPTDAFVRKADQERDRLQRVNR